MSFSTTDKALFSKAVYLRDSGEFKKAFSVLTRLHEKGSESVALFAVIGHVLWELGRLEEGAQNFRKAIDLSPRSVTASLGLFHCLWGQDKRVEALEEAKRFTSLTGSDEYVELVRELNE